MDNFEKHISSQLQNDKLSFGADAAIHDRLIYHMQVKSAKSAVRKNSLIPIINGLFTNRFLSVKIGVAAMLLISFMGYKQMNQNNSFIQLSDTVQVINNLDTVEYTLKDSILRN